jgi:DNA replication protein DnaC
MKETVVAKAKQIIDARRYNAENLAVENKLQALKDESFKNLYLAYTDIMIEGAKVGRINRTELANVKSMCEKRLKELKISSIEPNYHCKKCNDSGMNGNKYCDCLIEEINKILIEKSGFFSLENFKDANFDVFENKDFMKKLYAKMQKWCNSNFDKTLVLLAGQTGVGKTHLMKCMANELIKRHKVVMLTSSFAMHQDFLKSFSTRDNDEKYSLIDKYIDCEVLFIDDLGTELRNPNITVNYLYQILNERKINHRPTIITTNLKLDEIMDYYDERISSRIIDKTSSICVYIEGKDLRLKK